MRVFTVPYRTARTLVISASLAATLSIGAGCASYGVKVEQDTLAALHPGVTTCLDVRQRYGPPTSATLTSDGVQQLTYVYGQSQVKPENFIPIVGGLLGGGTSEQTTVVFDCDGRGTLLRYSSTQGQMGIGTGMISGQKQK